MSETPDIGLQMAVVDGKLPCDGRYFIRYNDGAMSGPTSRSADDVEIEATHYWYMGPLDVQPTFVEPEPEPVPPPKPDVLACPFCGVEPKVWVDVDYWILDHPDVPCIISNFRTLEVKAWNHREEMKGPHHG